MILYCFGILKHWSHNPKPSSSFWGPSCNSAVIWDLFTPSRHQASQPALRTSCCLHSTEVAVRKTCAFREGAIGVKRPVPQFQAIGSVLPQGGWGAGYMEDWWSFPMPFSMTSLSSLRSQKRPLLLPGKWCPCAGQLELKTSCYPDLFPFFLLTLKGRISPGSSFCKLQWPGHSPGSPFSHLTLLF